MTLLLQTGRATKAYDLIAAFNRNGRPTAPPTVYRALDFLVELGLVHRIETANTFLACQTGGHANSVELLICDCCGRTEDVDLNEREAIEDEAVRRGFALAGAVVELHGTCPRCRKHG